MSRFIVVIECPHCRKEYKQEYSSPNLNVVYCKCDKQFVYEIRRIEETSLNKSQVTLHATTFMLVPVDQGEANDRNQN